MKCLVLLSFTLLVAPPCARAAIKVHPVGVNVSSREATTVFLTFGGVRNHEPAEAFWCGALVSAAPDIGSKCDPATIFGSLPVRFDRSRPSGTGGLTDIMSIPPSVARRAYQAARSGQTSSFFYVRRFVSTVGGRDEYVAVTCRMAGGGARTPLALLDVRVAFADDSPVQYMSPQRSLPSFQAEIAYNGTGRLRGRWEVVLPGDELPTPDDLLTEASLPIELRGGQRRYTQLQRFNLYVPPTGRVRVPGPDARLLPTGAAGSYMILLRIEAVDDREADSDLTKAGAGPGAVHSGAVAGFPMPVLRYIVTDGATAAGSLGELELLLPAENGEGSPQMPLDFAWVEIGQAAVYRIDIHDAQGLVLSGLVPSGIGTYRAPPWVRARLADGLLRWRVVALDVRGTEIRESPWRNTSRRAR